MAGTFPSLPPPDQSRTDTNSQPERLQPLPQRVGGLGWEIDEQNPKKAASALKAFCVALKITECTRERKMSTSQL